MPNSPATWQVALHPWRVAALLLLLATVVECSIMLLLPDDLERRIGRAGVALVDAGLLSTLLTPCLWGIFVKPLHRLAIARRQLLDWAMQSEERRAAEIARDLHDDVGQLAAALNIGLRTIEELSRDQSIIEQTQHLRHVGRRLHESIRSVSRGLRPRALDQLGLRAAIASFVDDCRETSSAVVHADVAIDETVRLSVSTETAIFRVIQESVTNALRHGSPQAVFIKLWLEDERLCLEVTDDGCGFDIEATMAVRSGCDRVPFGLLSIRERVELLGGRMTLRSRPGAGTTVQTCIPCKAEPAG